MAAVWALVGGLVAGPLVDRVAIAPGTDRLGLVVALGLLFGGHLEHANHPISGRSELNAGYYNELSMHICQSACLQTRRCL